MTPKYRRDAQPLCRDAAHERGQSIAEFAMVLPMLILLLVGVADFARVFSAAIILESAVRNGAEIGAQEYLKDPPDPAASPMTTPTSWPTGYYSRLHRVAATAACADTRSLPNTVYNSSADTCDGMPLFRVCVHDGADDACTADPFGGTAAVPSECTELTTSLAPTPPDPSAAEPSHYVEVRTCYRFTMLLRIPALPFGATPPIGDIWLERTRIFPIADYYRL